jgi:hypothetical protein
MRERHRVKASRWVLVPVDRENGRMVGTAIAHAADVPAVEGEDAEVVLTGSNRAAFTRADYHGRW